jgi:hypothetical protein
MTREQQQRIKRKELEVLEKIDAIGKRVVKKRGKE